MTALFISYSTQDQAKAEHIRDWLSAEGFRVLPRAGDAAGRPGVARDRDQQLDAGLRQADGVIFLGTTASLASTRCAMELARARSLGKHLFYLAADDVRLPFPDDTAVVRLEDGEEPYSRLSQALTAVGLGPRDIMDWDPARSPYPGLASFTEADAAVFYGRKTEIDSLMGSLTAARAQEPARFVTVIGPSGTGKSSLVRAGVVPRLRRQPDRWLVLPRLVPGQHPVTALAEVLARARGAQRSQAGLLPVLQDLAGGTRLVLLVIDQAEELITWAGEAERDAFVRLISDALARQSPLRVVATLRSEFLSAILATSGMAEMVQAPLLLGALSPARLPEVITGPAIRAGLDFDSSVVQRMVADTVGGDALPLLAFTLRELSDRSRERGGRRISEADYETIGGVEGALRTQADALADQLRRDGLGELVLPTLIKLATVEGESEPTRRRLPRSVLSDTENQVVQAFVEARLLTSDRDGDAAAVTVAHEALLRQWPPLREAIAANREALRTRGDLERLAQDWRRAGRRDSYLVGGERLEEFQRWTAGQGDIAGELPLVAEFLDRSGRLDQATLARSSEAVARRALAVVDEDPEQCLLLALAAIEDYAPTPLAHQALMAALATPAVHTVLRGHQDAIWGVAWSPDGKCLATGSSDQTVRVWDAASGAELAVLRGHTAGVMGVAWSPDGQRLATASGDRTVRVWDAVSGAELAVLRGHQDAVWGVAWSPDGRWLATAGGENADYSARIWDAESGEQAVVLEGHEDWVEGVAWSPDGRRLATASGDRTVRVWDAASGAGLAVLRGHQDQARGVAWSPDGQRLASVSYDGTVRVWDAASGAGLVVLRGHRDAVRAVAWSPDGQRLATGSHDHTARIWDPGLGMELAVLHGHQDGIRWVAWSPDGARLATASHDATVKVWDATDNGEVPVLHGHRGGVAGVAWSPDGQRLASASADGTIQLWNPANATRTAVLDGHAEALWAVAWSPDGRRLASASGDGTVRLWDPAGANETMVLRGHDDAVRAVAWSPDGRRLASGSYDKTARIWNPSTGAELAVLRGHHDAVWGIAWSPDGERLATASHDRTTRIWDLSAPAELAVLSGYSGPVRAVTWSPDGRRLATASYDHTVEVWNAEQAAESLVLRGHKNVAEAVAWSPDGRRLATASLDCTVRVWDLITSADLPALMAKARERIFRDLTPDERKAALLNGPAQPR